MRTKAFRSLAAAAAALAALVAGSAVAGDKATEKRIKESRAKFNELWPANDDQLNWSHERRAAVEAVLAEEDPKAANIYIEQVLLPDKPLKCDWYVRSVAWRGLARALDGPYAKDAHA